MSVRLVCKYWSDSKSAEMGGKKKNIQEGVNDLKTKKR